jgi:hypothetical protein
VPSHRTTTATARIANTNASRDEVEHSGGVRLGGRRLLQVRCLLARLAGARWRGFLPLSARRREGWHRLRNPSDNLGIRARLALRQHLLYQLDGLLDLLVAHSLDAAGMLDLHLTRDKVPENLHITERAMLPTFLNRLAPMGLKIKQKRLEEFLIKEVTRMVPVAVRSILKCRGSNSPASASQSGLSGVPAMPVVASLRQLRFHGLGRAARGGRAPEYFR